MKEWSGPPLRVPKFAKWIPVNQLDECARCARALRVLPQSTLQKSASVSTRDRRCIRTGVRCK
eukprot:9734274-Alexandrium_andersonii.AAC.1